MGDMNIKEKILKPGENVLLQSKLHPIEVFGQLLWAPFIYPIIVWAWSHEGALALIAVALIGAFFRRASTFFIITNRRIVFRGGTIHKVIGQFDLADIEKIKINQGFLGKYWGYGKVVIYGKGRTIPLFSYRHIANPHLFLKVAEDQRAITG